MKAARIIEPMKIEIVDVEKPDAGDGQILVENKTTSICGSDMPDFLHERPMEYPRGPGVPGHENIGIVAQSRCKEYKEGDEVLVKVLEINDDGKIRLSRKAALGESLDNV